MLLWNKVVFEFSGWNLPDAYELELKYNKIECTLIYLLNYQNLNIDKNASFLSQHVSVMF